MKVCIVSFFFLLITFQTIAQRSIPLQDSIFRYFEEIKSATKKHHRLWDRNIYGAMLLVDPTTRRVFANEPDTAGILQPLGKVYSGTLPANKNIANAAVSVSGKYWAMIILPLPKDRHLRAGLLAHELFHLAQPSLGFPRIHSDNNHLDKREGRIYLRLELEALKKAVLSSSETETMKHLASAVSFRKYRNSLYPGSDTTENILELNEGLAEFTGVIISDRSKKQAKDYLVTSINTSLQNPTFVRSFAYQTIPVYGYLLSKKKESWNKEISIDTRLIDYFISAFNISVPNDLKNHVETITALYDGTAIISEETDREERTKEIVAAYKSKLVEEPHLEIQPEKMNFSFDPRNILPIDDKGTVYPSMRITDRWGILTVEKGALISSGWDRISVTIPMTMDGNKISGDGWILELTEGYVIEKDERTGNFILKKK
jgi:hypothetical protein